MLVRGMPGPGTTRSLRRHVARLPQVTSAPPHVSTSAPPVTAEQTPKLPWRAQELHTPLQAVSQHTPSRQELEMHSSAEPHVRPSRSLHVPPESHDRSPVHVSGSSAFVTDSH